MAKKNRHSYVEKNQKGEEDNLILGQNGEQTEQMKFRDGDNSRPDPSVEDELARRDTPFDKVDFPDAPEGYSNYEELLASEEYRNALEKIQQLTGLDNMGTGESPEFARLSNATYGVFKEVLQKEIAHEEELENLCVRIIREQFKIPEESLQFNFKLTREKLQMNNTPSKQQLKQREEELAEDIVEMTPERAKRRLINAMTQGHSVDKGYIFSEVEGELINILDDEEIVEKYSLIMAQNVLGYWQSSPETMDQGMGSDSDGEAGAGKSKIDTTTNPPTINADGLIFPVLVHEGLKGVMEYLGKERDPEDEEKSQTAMDLEDQVQHEVWDIRLGPAIWRRLYKLFPTAIKEQDNKKKLQYYIYSNIANLPVKEFLVMMKEVLQNSEDGKSLISAMYYDLTMVIDNEEVTEEGSHFKNRMREVMEAHGGDQEGLDDFLTSLGITISPN